MSTAASSTTEPPQAENEHTGRLEGAEGTTTSMDRRLGCWLICAGLIALASAAILVYERLQIYVDAGHTTVCDINGLLSCGTVMRTPQAEAFGFPNPFIGLVGFSIVVTIGAAILPGTVQAVVLDLPEHRPGSPRRPSSCGCGLRRPSISTLSACSA